MLLTYLFPYVLSRPYTLSMTSMTDSKIDSKTDSQNEILSWVDKIPPKKLWGDYSDSDDDSEPVRAPVPAPVQPKTWGKLPVRVEPVRVEPNRVEPVREQKPLQKPNNGIRTLMVKNLPRDTTPEKLTNELRSIFKAYGPIKDVYIPINRDGTYAGTIKGFAKVQFQNADHTAIAVSQSITIRKNKLGIEYAKEDR